MSSPKRVALLTLGCARNEVDSEELAGRLGAGEWELVDDAADADVVLVNTCGFVESAKKDSIDVLLEAADLKGSGRTQAVVAVGCLAERYGEQLAEQLPEADAVLGFDSYADISIRLDDVLAGRPQTAHAPRDRRTLLPVTPVERHGSAAVTPGHASVAVADPPDRLDGLAPASGPRVLRRRLTGGPVAPLKLASGCDRRCSFCAIPSFRGSFVSRLPADILAEAGWLAEQGVRELVLVSENSTSYGKDLGDLRALETLLPELTAVPGILRVRVAYLQPAELRPGLIAAMASTPGVAAAYDLSFQHASGAVLRRMRRFGDADRFLELLASVRAARPDAGARSNVIVGFPGETDADLDELVRFLSAARLDAIGVFAYSDEDGTEAAGLGGKLDATVIEERRARIADLVEELTTQRAEERIGSVVEILVEEVVPAADGMPAFVEGRAEHQNPEVDGSCSIRLTGGPADAALVVGALLAARVVASEGVDLVCELLG